MEKKDLQPGMIVERYDGYRGLIVTVMINNQPTDIILGENWYEFVYTYSWDLKVPKRSYLDIVRVYDSGGAFGLGTNLIQAKDLTLLWERPKPLEVTLQEVAEKFGVDSVKIVERL